jgi:heme exporter protein B
MPTSPSPSLLRHAARVAWKDLRVEVRSREILYTMAFFGALLVVVFTFVFPSSDKLVRAATPGMLWVSIAFAGTLGLGRAFDRERENDTMRALLLAPVPRLAVFLGKSIAIVVLVLGVAVIVVPMLTVLLQAPLLDRPLPLVTVLVLGAVGFSTVGTVFSASLLKVRSRDVLLPVIMYPLLVPLFVAGTQATAMLVAERPDLDKMWYWIRFLGIYDAAFLVVSLWIFESMVIE